MIVGSQGVDAAAQEAFDDGVRGRLFHGVAGVGHFSLAVTVEGALEQLLLAAERRIQAGPVDAHGVGEVGHRRSFVAVPPEDLDGAVEDCLLASRIAKAFTHIQASALLTAGRTAGDPDRLALSVASDFPDVVALVTRLYDEFGFDTVDNSPLRESWRTTPRQPAWNRHAQQDRAELARNLRSARFVAHARP